MEKKANHTLLAIELMQKARESDQDAFSELYDLYADALYGVVSQIVRSNEIAADVLQDAFVKIWKNLKAYDKTKASVFTWMLNIARNTAIDYSRKIRKKESRQIQNTEFDVSISIPQPGSDKSNHVGVKELMDKLPEDCSLVLRYLYFEGFTQQELSDELDIPLGTVKTRARKALKLMRQYFNLILFWI